MQNVRCIRRGRGIALLLHRGEIVKTLDLTVTVMIDPEQQCII